MWIQCNQSLVRMYFICHSSAQYKHLFTKSTRIGEYLAQLDKTVATVNRRNGSNGSEDYLSGGRTREVCGECPVIRRPRLRDISQLKSQTSLQQSLMLLVLQFIHWTLLSFAAKLIYKIAMTITTKKSVTYQSCRIKFLWLWFTFSSHSAFNTTTFVEPKPQLFCLWFPNVSLVLSLYLSFSPSTSSLVFSLVVWFDWTDVMWFVLTLYLQR